MRWAAARGDIAANPVNGISRAATRGRRDHVVRPEEAEQLLPLTAVVRTRAVRDRAVCQAAAR